MTQANATNATLVFVYGSLMEGFGNHDILTRNGAHLVGDYRFVGGLMVSLGAFPAVVTSQEGIVHGELYEVDANGLRDLDRLEGFNPDAPKDSMYIRRNVEIRPEDSDEIVRAEIYLWNSPRSIDYNDIVQSGDWRVRPLTEEQKANVNKALDSTAAAIEALDDEFEDEDEDVRDLPRGMRDASWIDVSYD